MDSKTPALTAVLLAMTMALAPLAIDAYLPAFPTMATGLDTTLANISLTIAVYVLLLALGQLIGGPMADRWGRKVVMLSGLAIFGLASLGISLSHSFEMLLLLRGLQAFGGGWAAVCVPALVRDRFFGNQAARFISTIGLIMIIAPAVAPNIGTLILSVSDWRTIFLFLSGYAAVLLALLWLGLFSKPSHSPHKTVHQSIWQGYATVLSTRRAMPYLLLQSLSFAVMLIFIAHSAFIYQSHFGASPQLFSLLFSANIGLMLVMNLINRALLNHFPSPTILRWGLTVQGIGITCLLLVSLLYPTLALFLPAMVLTIGSMGAITPNSQACYMDFFAKHGGTAAALLGASQFAIGAAITGFSSWLPQSLLTIVLSQAACSIACLVIAWRPSQRNQTIPTEQH
ncbi:multidrug effflux MFS transporter [Halioxenophilus sp. WMMB6]|uniref:multidrug effflux MFS transporter n=1 Tax=Halioxenophilus sp. WMMB6 TaxID=3073815 RepID=UPI00295F0BFD|nr:multidrug effflux MFS transporter [Halioxenophilus sp. WMMB6]